MQAVSSHCSYTNQAKGSILSCTQTYLAEAVGVGAEGEGVDGPGVLDLAAGLEEGCGAGRGAAARAQQQDPRRLGLLLLRVLQEHPAVVPGRVNVVHTRVVNLRSWKLLSSLWIVSLLTCRTR